MNNDIVTKARLNAALGTEGNMGFEHNDIVTVDKMNEAIAEGGGGGGSDFSTAQVTFVNDYNGYFPEIVEDESGSAIMFNNVTHSGIVIIPLYDGYFGMDVSYEVLLKNATYSGNAELFPNDILLITGDCTITVPEV